MPPTPPARREPPKAHAYKPPEDQEDWFAAKVKAGWSLASVLTEVVGTYMHLEKALARFEEDIKEFARAEGLLTEATPTRDWSWRREAVLRWMKLGRESWRASHKAKR